LCSSSGANSSGQNLFYDNATGSLQYNAI